MGSRNVLGLLEDHRLLYLSEEFNRLRMDMVRLCETRRFGSGEISSNGFTYYWYGMRNGPHVKGVAIGMSDRLQTSIVEITLV